MRRLPFLGLIQLLWKWILRRICFLSSLLPRRKRKVTFFHVCAALVWVLTSGQLLEVQFLNFELSSPLILNLLSESRIICNSQLPRLETFQMI